MGVWGFWVALLQSEDNGFVSVFPWGRKVALCSHWGHCLAGMGILGQNPVGSISWTHIYVAASLIAVATNDAAVAGVDAAGAVWAARGAGARASGPSWSHLGALAGPSWASWGPAGAL
eukprot:3672297-Pyramimonas_sp.AAC.1